MGCVNEFHSGKAFILQPPPFLIEMSKVKVLGISGARALKMDGHRLRDKVASALSLAGLRYGGAEQVAESLTRFGLMHGMIVVGGVGDPVSDGYFGIASLQADEGWRRVLADAVAVKNAEGVGKRVAEVAQALRGSL
jgi:multimeric flavodoxin WrbA